MKRLGVSGYCGLAALAFVLAPLVTTLEAMFEGDVAGRFAALDGSVLDRVVDTISVSLGAAIIALAFAIPFCLAIHRADFRGRRLLRALYVGPLLIPPHVHTISWMRIIGNNGWITRVLKESFDIDFVVRRGFLEVGGSPILWPGATWIAACSFWPIAALVISSGLQQLDPRPEEAALGNRSRAATLWGVTLPMVRPQLMAGALFVFLLTAGCLGIPALLDTPVIMNEVFSAAKEGDQARAAVVSLPLVLVASAALLSTILASSRSGASTATSRRLPQLLAPRSRRAGAVALAILFLTTGWPLFAMVMEAMNLGAKETLGRSYGDVFVAFFSEGPAGLASNARAIWKNVLPDIKASVELAICSAIVVTAAALALGTFLRRLPRRLAIAAEAAALLPFAFPALVVCVAVNIFWSKLAAFSWVDRFVYGGLGVSVSAWLMMFLPFALRAVDAALSRIPRGAEEAAALSGRSGGAILSRIVLPLAASGIGASMVLVWVLVMGELSVGIVVSAPGWQGVQVRIFNMIHFARDAEVAALCLVMTIFAVVPVALWALVTEPDRRPTR